jgi:hypothetical protein
MQGLTNIEQDGAVGYTLNTITKLLQKHGAKAREWTYSTLPRGERWAEACQGQRGPQQPGKVMMQGGMIVEMPDHFIAVFPYMQGYRVVDSIAWRAGGPASVRYCWNDEALGRFLDDHTVVFRPPLLLCPVCGPRAKQDLHAVEREIYSPPCLDHLVRYTPVTRPDLPRWWWQSLLHSQLTAHVVPPKHFVIEEPLARFVELGPHKRMVGLVV